MRKILLLTTLLISTLCEAQDTLFKIISVNGTVMLDRDTVTCGQHVTIASHTLTVAGKPDYVTILTEKGFAFRLTKGKYSVTEISNSTHSNIRTGVVIYEDPSDIKIAGPYPATAFMFGDSLTVIARYTKNNSSQYRLVIVNAYNEKLYDSISASYVHTINMSGLYGKEHFAIFHVEGETQKITSREYAAKELQPKDRARITHDFDCIPENDFISQELSILALCEIHQLYFDQIHHLYRLWKHSQTTGEKITHPYYQRLFNDYELEKFLGSVNRILTFRKE